MASSPGPTPSWAVVDSVDCLTVVSETLGMSGLEIEEPVNPKAPPKRQVSNVSMPKTKSGIGGACSNLVNSIVGAGIIGIPYALKESGIVAGAILLLAVSYFTDKSLRMIVELAHFHPNLKGIGVHTFEDLMYMPFGTWGHNFVLAGMLVAAYGAMLAYLLVIKDTLPVVLGFEDEPGSGSFVARELLMVGTSAAIMLPLSMQRDMSTLAYTSLLSIICDSVLVFFIAFFSPMGEAIPEAGGFGQVVKDNWINSGFFIGFGVLTTAMACQHSAFIVCGSLGNLTSGRWATVTCRSLVVACIMCSVLGICGYLGFLDETQGDVLNNFDPDTMEATAARLLLAVTMFFTYPMESFVARHVLVKLIFNGDIDGHTTDPNTGEVVEAPKFLGILNRRQKWTLIIYLATVLPALFIDDLGPVLSITGSIGGCSLSYIGPGLVYLGVNGEALLTYISEFLEQHRTPDASLGTGDATASLETPALQTDLSGPKPWWWWPALMPLWVHIGTTGANGMVERKEELERKYGPMPPLEEFPGETIGFDKRDALISCFFVSFGAISLVAGLASNFYVQVNEIVE